MQSRRHFLKRGLIGGALLASGAVGLGLWPTRRAHAPRRELQVIDERQFAVLAAVAARIVQAPGADPIDIAHRVDAFCACGSLEARRDLGRLLRLLDNGLAGLLLDGQLRPFTAASPGEQDARLQAWRDSRIAVRRSGYQVLRKLTTGAHYSSPTTWASVGYPGPPTISQPAAK